MSGRLGMIRSDLTYNFYQSYSIILYFFPVLNSTLKIPLWAMKYLKPEKTTCKYFLS